MRLSSASALRPVRLWKRFLLLLDRRVRGSSPRRPTCTTAADRRLPAALSRSPHSGTEGRVLEKLIIQKTLRVPASTGAAGDGTPVARQLDAALLDVGFSASGALLEHIGALAHGPAMDLAATVVSAV